MWFMLVSWFVLGLVSCQNPAPCPFNTMCLCKFRGSTRTSLDQVTDISCVGVPFSKIPELPQGEIEHVDIVRSGLEHVDTEAMATLKVQALRLLSNEIFALDSRTFTAMADVLQSLDLSFNHLEEIPLEAFSILKKLDWLNLQSNHITSLETQFHSNWLHLRDSLTNLYLGNNDLQRLLSRHEPHSLYSLHNLTWLNLDNNKLSMIEPGSLPESLQTLSVSNNQLTKFPGEAIDNLKSLTWVYIRRNNLESIQEYNFHHRKYLERLDLGENEITVIESNMFNGTLTVRDLNLDFNNLRSLPAQAFRNLNIGRLILSMNKLTSIDEKAFIGLGHTLELLDLERNGLESIPRALSSLKRLKYLYISSNQISHINNDDFDSFSSTLSVVSLSGNLLKHIPSVPMRDCKKIIHFNIGYNLIREIRADDFLEWGEAIEILLLRSNRITHLTQNMFKNTPHIRELSLSFNKITDINPDVFTDINESLEILEISFGLQKEEFPDDFLKPLRSLIWLALDNNNFQSISKTSLYSFGKLQYLNLESNRLLELPSGLFHPSIHKKLRDLRLSYNLINTIESDTFSSLEEMQSIVLTGNNIIMIKTNAFKSLVNCVTIILSENKISNIAPRAFNDLPNLMKLDFQSNNLKELSLSIFQNVSSQTYPMTLNLSRNKIYNLFPGDTGSPIYIKTLDVTFNKLTEVPVKFLQNFMNSLRRLHMSHNLITQLEYSAFGNLDSLEVLSLSHNNIAFVNKKTFHGIHTLQILDLSYNDIEQLQVEQFTNLENLRIINLSNNHIRSLPRDAFLGTKLERVDLSNNQFVVIPTGTLSEVGYTLRILDVSNNLIEHLDNTMFENIPFLTSLNLCNNKLTILPDNVFTRLGSILKLQLCSNPIRANFKELLHYVQKLRYLNLANTGLIVVPNLPLPNLISLNLSLNMIREMPENSVESLHRLRSLYIDHNQFTSMPSHVWHYVPLLRDLDVSHNPIKILTKDSFSGLSHLQNLNIQDLPHLERLDSGSLSNQHMLESLKIQTWPKIEKYRFRLASVLAAVPSLQKLSVKIQEKSLTDQLLGGFNHRLRELTITGDNLEIIHQDSLDGIEENNNLILTITNTKIDSLPLALLAKLIKIGYLTVDLHNNQFKTLSLEGLYTNSTSWENMGTKIIPGGLLLKGNPWKCDNNLVWLSEWLRRWLREQLQIHTATLESGLHAVRVVREAMCTDPHTHKLRPIIDLRPEDVVWQGSALSTSMTLRSNYVMYLSVFYMQFLYWSRS